MHSAVDFQRVENRQRFVHAHSDGVFRLPAAFDQRQVHALAGLVFEGVGGEFAKSGLQRACANGFN